MAYEKGITVEYTRPQLVDISRADKIPIVPDEKEEKYIIPLDGQWMPGVEPALIGKNFSVMTNMRYGPGRPVTVPGMTKINSAAAMNGTYSTARSAFHFKKAQPSESHVLVQAYGTNGTMSAVLQHTTAIPGTGGFSASAIWTDSTAGASGTQSRGVFSDAPNGQIIYTNKRDTCIWGGDEIRCAAFITSTAAITDSGAATNPKDYTDIINNTKQDGDNVAIIGGGIDSYVGLMLHGDGVDASETFTDSSTAGAAKTVEKVGATNTQIDTAWAAFGTGSILFDGTGDGLTTADHADFYPASSVVTFDEVIYIAVLPITNQAMILFSQRADAANCAIFYLKNCSGVYSFTLMLKTAGVTAYPIKDLVWTTPVKETKYHIALIRGWGGAANSWTVAIEGTSLGATTLATAWPNVAAAFQIGVGTTEVLSTYPPAQSDTYVKVTTKLNTNYWPYFATDPSKLLTGDGVGTSWLSEAGAGGIANQRINMDAGVAIILVRVYYENFHNGVGSLDIGAKNFKLWGSASATAFADTTWLSDADMIAAGWTQLTALDVLTGLAQFTQHAAADASDPQYLTVAGAASWRYYSWKFADNWGAGDYMGVKRIELNPATAIAFNGHMDEIRWSHTAAAAGIARWTADFTPQTIPYSAAARTWLIGSLRPLQAQKYYISNGNTTASTMTGKVWNGNTWQTMTIVDNTDTGASLAATGTVTFASTVGIAKPKYLEGYFLYWYQFSIDAGEAELYQVTLDAPFQPLADIWDGVFRNVARFYEYKTAYLDNTLNVYTEDYDAATPETYYAIGGLLAYSSPNNLLEIGFTEKQTAVDIVIAVPNTTAATTAYVDYWDGTAYVSAGTITDGTSEGAISLAKTGVISWNNNSLANETKKVVSNSLPLYYYRLRFDKDIIAGARIDYVGGISAGKQISGYSFGLHAADRLMLGCDNYEKKNEFLISAQNSPDVLNGDDVYRIEIGTDSELTCAAPISAQYASNIYNMVLAFKPSETWIMKWTQSDTGTEWERFCIAPKVGCPAPATLQTASVSFEKNINQTKVVGIWRAYDGIYVSDGRAPLYVSDQIATVFDQTSDLHVNLDMLTYEYSFVDHANMEYHWLWASGTSRTLGKEYILDLKEWRWFEIDRGTGNRLQCGCSMSDIIGNKYTYGFIDTGYMERLENGVTFDGTNITSTLQTGDQLPVPQDLFAMTRITRANLIALAKCGTSGTKTTSATMTHNLDGGTAGSTFTLSDAADGTHRYINTVKDVYSEPGIFHNFKFVKETDEELKGFEPLYFAVNYVKIRDHTK